MIKEYIDLHGFNVIESKVMIDNIINSNKYAFELTIVHGYHSDILLSFIRREYKHKRIIKKVITMNKGETIYMIKTS